jgi:hypothetical protein
MDCVVINGYFPSLTIKSVLNTITEEILGTEDTFSSNTEHVAHILRYVEPEPETEPECFPVPEPDLDLDLTYKDNKSQKSKMRGKIS